MLFLCVAGIVCIVIPCLAWLGFMVWVITEGQA
jgi:hypothetical protein